MPQVPQVASRGIAADVRSSRRRRDTLAVELESDGLTPAQHVRVKRAHHHYEWRQAVARNAAARNPWQCVCMIDREVAPTVQWLPPESTDRRKDPKRAGAEELALYGLLRSMALDPETRTVVNGWLVAPETAPHEPEVVWLYAWLGHRAPLSRETCFRAMGELAPAVPMRAPKEPIKAVVYLDAAGAHMDPQCAHSDLWRTTRPTDAVLRRYYRVGAWPDDLRSYRSLIEPSVPAQGNGNGNGHRTSRRNAAAAAHRRATAESPEPVAAD